MALKQQRNYGIDLLRMVAMFMVAVLHVLYQGGILGRVYVNTPQHPVAWFLELASYGAVNIYALISGYVGITSKYRVSNILVLWLEVFFYSFGIAIVYMIARPDLYDGSGLTEYAFPVVTNKYWYFSAYVVLFLFMPLLNAGVNALSQRTLRRITVAMVLVFSVLTSVAKELAGDPFVLVGGYTGIWLMILYVIGAYIGKYGMWKNVSKPWLFLIWLGCSALSLAIRSGVAAITRASSGAAYYTKFTTSYPSPLFVIGSIALLLLFSRIQPGNIAKKIIAFLSPAAFGVYIIHVHPLVWEHIMKDRFAFLAKLYPWFLAINVLLGAFGVYLLCTLIDLVRIQVFRLLRIKRGCQALEKALFEKDEDLKQKIGNRS